MNAVQEARMSPLIWTGGTPWARSKPLAPLCTAALLMLASASCVPSAGIRPLVIAPPSPEARAQAIALATPAAAAIASFTALPEATVTGTLGAPGAPVPAVLPGAAPAINAAIAFAAGPNPSAPAFFLRGGGADTQAAALRCLTEAIYYEAASETEDGQRAVAQVILNRVRHPAYPATVCGVVYQNAERWMSCQFSYACDGARARTPSVSGWARARAIAAGALAGRTYAPVGLATHYHTHNVVPFWAYKLEKNAVVGMHNFYRLNGALGRAPAFRQRYAGYEPAAVPMRAAPPAPVLAALAVEPVPVVTVIPVPPVAVVVSEPKPASRRIAPVADAKPVVEQSPIMQAVDASTVREEYRDSGTIRPEFMPGR